MYRLDVLIVEDLDSKFLDVKTALSSTILSAGGTISRAEDFMSATKELQDRHFDLVILDIMLPYIKGGAALRSASDDIVATIMSDKTGSPSYIIGLTEFEEEAKKKLPLEFFSVEIYSSMGTRWAENIVRHIEYIVKSKNAALSYHHRSFDIDALIITARYENEFVPIEKYIEWEEGSKSNDEVFADSHTVRGIWNTKSGLAFKTAIMCVKYTGLSSTAAVASAAISYYRPRIIAMLGMCCGLNEPSSSDIQDLGDIVIMTSTNCWDEGRYTQSLADPDVSFFEARPSFHGLNRDISKICDEIVEAGRGKLERSIARQYQDHYSSKDILVAGKEIPRSPRVRLGMNVSGSSVVAARTQTAEIMKRFPGAKSLEMEAHALYTASYLSPGAEAKAICIKGIADFGDGSKSKEFQKISSLGSVIVFEDLLERHRNAYE